MCQYHRLSRAGALEGDIQPAHLDVHAMILGSVTRARADSVRATAIRSRDACTHGTASSRQRCQLSGTGRERGPL